MGNARNGGSNLTFGSALSTVRLHRHVCIEMVQSTICLLATVPSTLVHALDLLVPTTGALVLLSTGNGDKGVDLERKAEKKALAKPAPRRQKDQQDPDSTEEKKTQALFLTIPERNKVATFDFRLPAAST